MQTCECIYCYDGLCFKPGKEEDMIAVPCDGCADTTLDAAAHNIIV